MLFHKTSFVFQKNSIYLKYTFLFEMFLLLFLINLMHPCRIKVLISLAKFKMNKK